MHFFFLLLGRSRPASRFVVCLLLVLPAMMASGCKDDPGSSSDDNLQVITRDEFTLNPSGYAPLTANFHVESETPVTVAIRVVAIFGDNADVVRHFDEAGTKLTLPVLGLYGGSKNTIEATFFDAESGNELGTRSYSLVTPALIDDLPRIKVVAMQEDRMADGMTFVSYFGHDIGGSPIPQRPFIFDRYGIVRWYLDFSTHPELNSLFYENGLERLKNGNFFFGDTNTNKIYEVDMMGRVQNSWELPGFTFHHDVIEKDDGNFLVAVTKEGINTVQDHIIEIDRDSNEILNVWDLNQALDNSRRVWDSDLAVIEIDWLHANALTYDESDNSITVSGRTQGVIKLTENNEVVWILAPHKGWETAGNGSDLNDFLLTPLDRSGNPITDPDVLNGDANHPEFEWSWYQHSNKLMPNGNVLVFDNGENRNYSETRLYSRAVEYEIDEENMTVSQVWSYGKQRGEETYSKVVSDADYIEEARNIVFSPGATRFEGLEYGKVIEVDYDQRDVVYEATIIPPLAAFRIHVTLHRTERLPLYPAN